MSTYTQGGGSTLKISFTGIGQVRAKLKGVEFSGADLAEAIMPELYGIDAESKRRTPVLTGRLRNSHRVIEPTFTKTTGGQISAGMVVNDCEYAPWVHDIPANHPNGGEDHFLINAATVRSKGAASRIAKRIRSKVR